MKVQKKWYKLDAFAKTYSSIISEGRTTCFRLSVLLSEEIDVELLKKVSLILQEKYPFYNSELKKGIFWNYLQHKKENFTVDLETTYPCTDIKKKNPLRIIYYKKKISIEIAHFLTDGVGATEFLKDLIEKYLEIKYFNKKIENEYEKNEKCDFETAVLK
ncbi:MAG: alcohol acetyltransferase, partial [Pseudoleptotrichia goodfellowii]|nr:alcohol acetyltransferase [Pseudoleptotrichia goodfellowii]